MKSFFFWLSVALGIGALMGSILRPGVLEIVIVIAALNGLFYGLRSFKSRKADPKVSC
ncbi:hypothetical protein SAMN02745166_04001 [Prosthecobacter debontii]|uniref:Uncharacterized protein n=1 Tax=Prosthecobacter debontii TaxID=48467 RepID=A0A1T4YQQ0_9BACT|nr:hypothetical protein [Prosthecobacter debontii]SKB04174.1 hypothetical protein SAMN02745166_04001 [Prosthecobacter debontii]